MTNLFDEFMALRKKRTIYDFYWTYRYFDYINDHIFIIKDTNLENNIEQYKLYDVVSEFLKETYGIDFHVKTESFTSLGFRYNDEYFHIRTGNHVTLHVTKRCLMALLHEYVRLLRDHLVTPNDEDLFEFNYISFDTKHEKIFIDEFIPNPYKYVYLNRFTFSELSDYINGKLEYRYNRKKNVSHSLTINNKTFCNLDLFELLIFLKPIKHKSARF